MKMQQLRWYDKYDYVTGDAHCSLTRREAIRIILHFEEAPSCKQLPQIKQANNPGHHAGPDGATMPPKRKQPTGDPPKASPSQKTLNGGNGTVELKTKTTSADQGSSTFSITSENKEIICQRFPPSSAKPPTPPSLIFTHGAGGGISNPATSLFADGFSQKGSPVICFQGTMNLVSRVKGFHAVIKHEKAENAALGGRSMGARAAVVTMTERGVKSGKLILASYPLLGQNGDVRDKILLEIDEGVEVLFISGDGDNMCDLKQLHGIRSRMKAKSCLIVVKGADHGMSMRPKEAVEKMREYTGEAARNWAMGGDREEGKTECLLRWDAHGRNVVDEGWKEAEALDTAVVTKSKNTGKAIVDQAEESARPPKRRKKG